MDLGAVEDSGDLAGVTVHRVFYNGCVWDGNDSPATAADDDAVASDKRVRVLSEPGTFANDKSCLRGLNGLRSDIVRMPDLPSVQDFSLRQGNSRQPDDWIAAKPPAADGGPVLGLSVTRDPNKEARHRVQWKDPWGPTLPPHRNRSPGLHRSRDPVSRESSFRLSKVRG